MNLRVNSSCTALSVSSLQLCFDALCAHYWRQRMLCMLQEKYVKIRTHFPEDRIGLRMIGMLDLWLDWNKLIDGYLFGPAHVRRCRPMTWATSTPTSRWRSLSWRRQTTACWWPSTSRSSTGSRTLIRIQSTDRRLTASWPRLISACRLRRCVCSMSSVNVAGHRVFFSLSLVCNVQSP